MTSVQKIAVVGASGDRNKFGNLIVRDLKRKGYEIFPVNKKGGIIENEKVYTSIEELPENTDLVVFVIPRDESFEVLKRAVEKGYKNFWFQPGTFSEKANEYLERHPQINYSAKGCVMAQF
ncbi:CoA-binding protein [candidate division WOR-3 bacterium]|nr:CoA-binding protein [candidate division WOR-3 bacterium]